MAGASSRRELCLTLGFVGSACTSGGGGGRGTWLTGTAPAKQDFTHASLPKKKLSKRTSFLSLKCQAQSQQVQQEGRHREARVPMCPQMGYGRTEYPYPTNSIIGTGHGPRAHSTPPCGVTGTLNNFPFVFLPGRDLVSVKMNYLSVWHEMSRIIGKTGTNPHTRSKNPLRMLTYSSPNLYRLSVMNFLFPALNSFPRSI